MSSANMWDDSQVENYLKLMPPKFNKMPGRPKKLRKRNKDELATGFGNLGKKFQDSLRCRVCWQYGHNPMSHKKKQTHTKGDARVEIREYAIVEAREAPIEVELTHPSTDEFLESQQHSIPQPQQKAKLQEEKTSDVKLQPSPPIHHLLEVHTTERNHIHSERIKKFVTPKR